MIALHFVDLLLVLEVKHHSYHIILNQKPNEFVHHLSIQLYFKDQSLLIKMEVITYRLKKFRTFVIEELIFNDLSLLNCIEIHLCIKMWNYARVIKKYQFFIIAENTKNKRHFSLKMSACSFNSNFYYFCRHKYFSLIF